MDNEKKFNVDEGRASSEASASRPTTGQPTPTAPLRHPGTGAPAGRGAKVPERRVRGGTAAAAAAAGRPAPKQATRAATSDEDEGGVFFLFTPGVLLFSGALVLAALWAGGLFVDAGADWPWEAFRSDDGASWSIQWSAIHILTALGALIAVFFLIASFFPSTPGRGVAVLTFAALGLVVLSPTMQNYLLYVGAAVLGFAGGAVIARAGLQGSRGPALVAVLLLGAVLFMPHVTATDTYESTAWNLGQALFSGEGDRSMGDVLQEPQSALILILVVMLVVTLLVWLGLGGAWAVWVAGLALLLGVLGPLVLLYLESARSVEGEMPLPEAFRGVATGLVALAAFLAFALPVAAGVLDVGRRDRI